MIGRATLRRVSTTVLADLRDAIASGALSTPVNRAALVGFGVRHQLDALDGALAGHKSAACLAVLDVALAEREGRRPPTELVWTGPEAPAGKARDTAIVLRSLFESARSSVILAGYSFDHARDVLAPLHASMTARGVRATFFVDVPQIEPFADRAAHLEAFFHAFMAESWPFDGATPRLFYDKRALAPGPPWCSLHAKCVVTDATKAFVSSANFTQRGQERNIEVGVLIEDASFASTLVGQWLALIEAAIVEEYVPPAPR